MFLFECQTSRLSSHWAIWDSNALGRSPAAALQLEVPLHLDRFQEASPDGNKVCTHGATFSSLGIQLEYVAIQWPYFSDITLGPLHLWLNAVNGRGSMGPLWYTEFLLCEHVPYYMQSASAIWCLWQIEASKISATRTSQTLYTMPAAVRPRLPCEASRRTVAAPELYHWNAVVFSCSI